MAGKLAWRVREGAAREKGRNGTSSGSLPLPRKPASRAQASGAACREIRAIWRKPDCLNPSLQKAQDDARRKDTCNRRRPLRRDAMSLAAILRGAGAMPCQGIQGDGRDA